MPFGDKLQALRHNNGLTQEAFAEQLNVSRQAVSRWESNRGYPEMEKILYICNRYGVTPNALFAQEVPSVAAQPQELPPEEEMQDLAEFFKVFGDATRVKIRLTDLYNEENYVTISLNHFTDAWATGHIYVTAGAAHQPQIGVENAGNPDAINVHIDDSYGYGAAINCAMSGLPKSPTDTHFTMYCDYEGKAFYADRESYSGVNQLIADLDDPFLVGDDPWAGFTTGQVKLTIFATNYQSAACNFTIFSVFSTI